MGLINPCRLKGLLILLLVTASSAEASERFCSFEPVSKSVYVINGSNAATCPPETLRHPVTNRVAIVGESTDARKNRTE